MYFSHKLSNVTFGRKSDLDPNLDSCFYTPDLQSLTQWPIYGDPLVVKILHVKNSELEKLL